MGGMVCCVCWEKGEGGLKGARSVGWTDGRRKYLLCLGGCRSLLAGEDGLGGKVCCVC